MVQLMSSKKSSVKLEVEESLEDQLGPLHKRSKLDSSLQVLLHFPFNFLSNQAEVFFFVFLLYISYDGIRLRGLVLQL